MRVWLRVRLCYIEESAKLLGRRGRRVGTDIEVHGRAGPVGRGRTGCPAKLRPEEGGGGRCRLNEPRVEGRKPKKHGLRTFFKWVYSKGTSFSCLHAAAESLRQLVEMLFLGF